MFLMLALSLAQAAPEWEQSWGGTGIALASRSSAGNHRIHPGIGVWYQDCNDSNRIQRCWGGQIEAATNGQQIPGGVMRSTLTRVTIMKGYKLGQEATKISFSAGPSMQVAMGGIDELVILYQPSGYAHIGIQKPLPNSWLLAIGNGYAVHVSGFIDADVSIGVGRRW